MVAPPKEPYLSDPKLLTALCLWREARGESRPSKVGVYWVLKNRCIQAPAQGFAGSLRGNILKPWAFSSFNADDPNSTKYPQENDPSWKECLEIVNSLEPDPDPTDDAVFYFSPPLTTPPHAWGPVTHTTTIGNLHFYKL